MQVQLGNQVAVVSHGKLVTTADVQGVMPHLFRALPAAILAGPALQQPSPRSPRGGEEVEGDAAAHGDRASGSTLGDPRTLVKLWGLGLGAPQAPVLCRQGGEQEDVLFFCAGGDFPRASQVTNGGASHLYILPRLPVYSPPCMVTGTEQPIRTVCSRCVGRLLNLEVLAWGSLPPSQIGRAHV